MTTVRTQGCNSIDILEGLNLCLNPRLNHFPTRRLPKCVLNPCLNLRLNSSHKFQMSIELHPRSLELNHIVKWINLTLKTNMGWLPLSPF